MKKSKLLQGIVGSVLLLAASLAEAAYSDRQDVRQFIQKMVKKHQLNKATLTELFRGAEKQNVVLKAMAKPAEGVMQWHRYRRIFLTDNRINKGVAFWRDNRALLEKAEKEFGVPARIIVAIIGVETYYGKRWGTLPVLDTLITLAFDYPKRAKFFTKELEHFLLLQEQESIDVRKVTGSYAGAMGMPQFISSSYRAYAVDFDGDGRRDLWNSKADVIGSVANYFKRHGWTMGQPVTEQLHPKGNAYKSLLSKKLKPKRSAQQLKKAGFAVEAKKGERFSVTEFIQKKSTDVWLGRHNFYVITRYNHSPMYAMAVYQLSEEIAKKRQQEMNK
ncbi:MAG: lytic murein transglycosylase B [Gammaproteobacteria bacterium]|nr:lytic murein transglycosylase B [Gammaproteobacteria bacterium]